MNNEQVEEESQSNKWMKNIVSKIDEARRRNSIISSSERQSSFLSLMLKTLLVKIEARLKSPSLGLVCQVKTPNLQFQTDPYHITTNCPVWDKISLDLILNKSDVFQISILNESGAQVASIDVPFMDVMKLNQTWIETKDTGGNPCKILFQIQQQTRV